MTDHQLLKLAAKAAGLDYSEYAPGQWAIRSDPEFLEYVAWHPLTDDGDALRLAVKLDLLHTYHMDSPLWLLHFDATDPDKEGATRRAIVMAAAEIGRQMP